MEAKYLVINSLRGENPVTRGFFVPLEQKTPCYHCKDEFYVMHHTTQGRFWCATCYVKKYCHIIRKGEDFTIKMKNPPKILMQSFPITEKDELNQSDVSNGENF